LALVGVDRLLSEENIMKRLVVALTAIAAFTGSALAADMAPRYSKAPPPAPVAVASWTGCYIAGGGGYGLWNQENTSYDATTVPRTQLTGTTTAGGRGYFGTVGAGCDYQMPLGGWNLVIGAFGDYDFASMKGDPDFGLFVGAGREKLDSQWSVGGRVGALVTPNLLVYFSGGYTEAHYNQVNLNFNAAPFIGVPTGTFMGSRNYSGYFLGAGDEYALSFLPGLFWKTEYRFSDLDTRTNPVRLVATNALTGVEVDSRKYVHTVRSELVYRFNWGGSVVAKY
jgi:outer membrane immunogenic protein